MLRLPIASRSDLLECIFTNFRSIKSYNLCDMFLGYSAHTPTLTGMKLDCPELEKHSKKSLMRNSSQNMVPPSPELVGKYLRCILMFVCDYL